MFASHSLRRYVRRQYDKASRTVTQQKDTAQIVCIQTVFFVRRIRSVTNVACLDVCERISLVQTKIRIHGLKCARTQLATIWYLCGLPLGRQAKTACCPPRSGVALVSAGTCSRRSQTSPPCSLPRRSCSPACRLREHHGVRNLDQATEPAQRPPASGYQAAPLVVPLGKDCRSDEQGAPRYMLAWLNEYTLAICLNTSSSGVSDGLLYWWNTAGRGGKQNSSVRTRGI